MATAAASSSLPHRPRLRFQLEEDARAGDVLELNPASGKLVRSNDSPHADEVRTGEFAKVSADPEHCQCFNCPDCPHDQVFYCNACRPSQGGLVVDDDGYIGYWSLSALRNAAKPLEFGEFGYPKEEEHGGASGS